MNHFEKLIREAGTRETLTDGERARMRTIVREYASMKPVPEDAAPVSAAPSPWLMLLRRPAYAALMAVLVLGVSTGGVAFAAESALPGDALYAVKVSLTEPARIALAADSSGKAALEMTFAERRLTEAATLANEGRLTPATEASLAVDFNAHTEAAAEAARETGDEEEAEIAVTAFADRLSAYDRVLSVAKKPADATTASALQLAISDQVRALSPVHAEMMTTMAAPMAFSKATTASDARMAEDAPAKDPEKLERAADVALRATASLVGSASSTLDASTSASARAELEHARALFERAHALLEAHDDAGARATFKDALSATSRLNVLTRAAAHLKINVFSSASAGSDPEAGDASSSVPVLDSSASTSVESSVSLPPVSDASGRGGEDEADDRDAPVGRRILPSLPFGL
jgi:hypothetical protein